MADSTPLLAQITAGQAQKEVTANGLFDAASPATAYGRHAEACIGLTWAYYGTRYGGSAVANGTNVCGASTTTYMVVNLSTGAVSFATSTTNWNDSATYGRAYKIVTGTDAVTSYEDHRFGPLGIFPAKAAPVSFPIEIQIACSDLVTALTTGTSKGYVRAPCAMTLTSVRASLRQASSSGAVTVDINDGGTTILSTKLTIDQSEKTSVTAATPFVFDTGGESIADDAEITIDIDGAGATAMGLIVTLIGTRA